MTSDAWTLSAKHLIICKHGLLGSERDFRNIGLLFREHHSRQSLYIHSAKCNSRFLGTHDGIDEGGFRLADEVQEVASRMPNIERISFIGHSLGGLYVRYCIGLLFARGFFDNVQPSNFITLASPHVGVRRPKRSLFTAAANFLSPIILLKTGQQLYLKDIASKDTTELSRPDPERHVLKQDAEFLQECLQIATSHVFEPMNDIPADENEFRRTFCKVANGVFTVYTPDLSHELYTVRLSRTKITLILPRESDVDGSDPYQIVIIPNEPHCPSTLIHIPLDEYLPKWKWVVAIARNGFGLICESYDPKNTLAVYRQRANRDHNSTLSCLSRGQFLQALHLFKHRSLYSNIFLDLQVPYSSAAIRAYNSYREGHAHLLLRSSKYPSITEYSISNSEPSTSVESVDVSKVCIITQSKTVSKTRSDPCLNQDKTIILDQAHTAFRSDTERNTLRGILVSLQCIGWTRFDVYLNAVLAHEKIMAKRANVLNKTDSGVDIVSHIIHTFKI